MSECLPDARMAWRFGQVKATAGDTHLGGEDFDNRLVNFFVQVCLSVSARESSQKCARAWPAFLHSLHVRLS
jgi:Hsp70 protein